jgi:CBS domain-containing protein
VDEALATLRIARRRCAAVLRGDHLAGVVYATELAALLAAHALPEAPEPDLEALAESAAPGSP